MEFLDFEEDGPTRWIIFLDRYSAKGYNGVIYIGQDYLWGSDYLDSANEMLAIVREFVCQLWKEYPFLEFEVYVSSEPTDDFEIGVQVPDVFDDDSILLGLLSV